VNPFSDPHESGLELHPAAWDSVKLDRFKNIEDREAEEVEYMARGQQTRPANFPDEAT
jgi:hypothetical protein